MNKRQTVDFATKTFFVPPNYDTCGVQHEYGEQESFSGCQSETYHCSRKKHDETSCQTKALVHAYGMDRHYRHVATLEINIPMHHP